MSDRASRSKECRIKNLQLPPRWLHSFFACNLHQNHSNHSRSGTATDKETQKAAPRDISSVAASPSQSRLPQRPLRQALPSSWSCLQYPHLCLVLIQQPTHHTSPSNKASQDKINQTNKQQAIKRWCPCPDLQTQPKIPPHWFQSTCQLLRSRLKRWYLCCQSSECYHCLFLQKSSLQPSRGGRL